MRLFVGDPIWTPFNCPLDHLHARYAPSHFHCYWYLVVHILLIENSICFVESWWGSVFAGKSIWKLLCIRKLAIILLMLLLKSSDATKVKLRTLLAPMKKKAMFWMPPLMFATLGYTIDDLSCLCSLPMAGANMQLVAALGPEVGSFWASQILG